MAPAHDKTIGESVNLSTGSICWEFNLKSRLWDSGHLKVTHLMAQGWIPIGQIWFQSDIFHSNRTNFIPSGQNLPVAMEFLPSTPREPSTTAIIASNVLNRSLSTVLWGFLSNTCIVEQNTYPEHWCFFAVLLMYYVHVICIYILLCSLKKC